MQTQTATKERSKPLFKRNLLELGVKDGIAVRHNDEGYIVQMPDRYDNYFALVGNNKPGQIMGKVAPLDESQTVKDIQIFVPLDALADNKKQEQVGLAIAHARKTNAEILHEIDLLSYQNAWKLDGNEPVKQAAPKAEVGKTVSMDGELTAVGKYFVSMRKIDEETNKPVLVSIPTNRILKFADGDFRDTVDRAARVKEKLGLTPDDFKGGDLKEGIKKTFHFDSKGNCTMVHNLGEKDIFKQSVPIELKQTKTKTLTKTPTLTMN